MDRCSILDCTLRDGGYITDWYFGEDTIRNVIKGLSLANLDYVECGYLNPSETKKGMAVFHDIEMIGDYFPNINKKPFMLAMADCAQILPEQITPYTGKSIEGIRVVFYKHQIKEALELCRSVKKQGYRNKTVKEIELADIKKIQERHKRFLMLNYNKTKGFQEVFSKIVHIFEREYDKLFDIEMDSILIIKEMLDIKTPIVNQSELEYDKNNKKSDLMLALCEAVGATVYLSGQGSKEYMQVSDFEEKGIKVEFQNFIHLVYEQRGTQEFVPKLSAIDFLMQLGIDDAKEMFWKNIK